jgi:ubiquinone/menaquinone biosynthesis C-methylase UbiE/uncharacterized protein YbaR (Trm112 family)
MFQLISILVSPKHKKPLYYNKISETLVCDEGEFEIHEGIPILLAKDNLPNYVVHYQKDAEYFDYFAPRFPETEKEENRVNQYIVSRIPPNARLIADIGCGNGWLARSLLRMDRIVCSLDISFKNVRKVIEINHSENHFGIVADAYFLPFKDSSFDCVVASEIIEHLAEPVAFLKELVRVVKSNGKVIITTPYKEKIRYTLCIHCNKPTPMNAHLHSFDEGNLSDILKQVEGIRSWRFFKFGNSLVQYFRLYRIFSIFPFALWKLIDKFLNLFFLPKHILIEIIKE